MGNSLGLAGYLGLMSMANGYAKRHLEKRLQAGKEDPARIGERFGEATVARPDGILAWFHAASVGESLSLLELIRRVQEQRPDVNVLVTTGTVTSAEMMDKRLPEDVIHQFVPVDTRDAVQNFLAHWQPDLAIWTESELWPTLMHETNAKDIPMVLINARMKKASHDGWRWIPGMAKSLLRRFDFVLAQDNATDTYLRRLGLPKERIEVTGTLKEGSAALPHNEPERKSIAADLAGRPVWLAASTHEGEELIAAKAHKAASRSVQRLLLIVAPRHPERGPDIAKSLEADGWDIGLRSRGDDIQADMQIYVADTLGEMGLWFRVAPVSFIGGSLTKIGGHNPFEPAALGSAIIHGPHVFKVADIYAKLEEANATVEVDSADTLAKAVVNCLSPDKAASMAHAAWEVSSSGAQVTDRALLLLQEFLPESTA